MALRTVDTRSSYSGHQNPLVFEGVHDCINMMSANNVVTYSKYYGSAQPNMGNGPRPTEFTLHIDKPQAIPKGVLKHSGHNPNARAHPCCPNL